MAIYARPGGGATDFIPCPVGLQNAVCCDVVDNGIVEGTFGGNEIKKHYKVTLYWQSEHLMADGRPFVTHRRYNNSLHTKAVLRKDLESWRSRPFTVEEVAKFNLEKLIGVPATLNITHNRDNQNRVWANVVSVLPMQRGAIKLTVSEGYQRFKDRIVDENPDEETVILPTVDEIPF